MFLLLGVLLVVSHGCHAADLFGTVLSMTGSAKVQRGAVGPWLNLSIGKPIYIGDRAVTASDCRLELTLAIGGVMRIEEHSQVDFESRSGGVVGLRVWLGRVWSSVTKLFVPSSKFEVSTPTAVAAVRGTEFYVDVDNAEEDRNAEDKNSDTHNNAQPPSVDDSGVSEEGKTHIGVVEGEVEVTDLSEMMKTLEENGGRLEGATNTYSFRLHANESIGLAHSGMLQRHLRKPIDTVAVLPFIVAIHRNGQPFFDVNRGRTAANHFARELQRAAQGRFKVIFPDETQRQIESAGGLSSQFFHSHAFATVAHQAGWGAIITATITDKPAHRADTVHPPAQQIEPQRREPKRSRSRNRPSEETGKRRRSPQRVNRSVSHFASDRDTPDAQLEPSSRPSGGRVRKTQGKWSSPASAQQESSPDKSRNRWVITVRCILARSGTQLISRRMVLSGDEVKTAPANNRPFQALVNAIVRSVPYIAPVMKVEGDTVTLQGGSAQGMRVGEQRVVLKKSDDWQDPRTGIRLGSKRAAIIEVVSVQSGQATAMILRRFPTTTIEVGDVAPPRLSHLERASPPKPGRFNPQRFEGDEWLRWNQGRKGER